MLDKKILVIGGTGYVGTRLVQLLLELGYTVRVTWRSQKKIKLKLWYNHPNIETVWADAYDRESILNACIGCTAVFYLVHSMYPDQQNFEQADKIAAENMVYAANNSSIEKIIYLSGLGSDKENASRHLRSRGQVGNILRTSKVPVTILRAAMIIGSGSTSFEILRHIVERLPIMVTPKWVYTNSQPIAIRNVVEYLAGCINNGHTNGKTFDIGGPEILSYKKLMEIYAEEANLRKRLVITLPFNDPFHSSSLFLSTIIPMDSSVIRPLIGGLRTEVICENNDIQTISRQNLLTPRDAIRRSLVEIKKVLIHDALQFEGWTPPVEWSYFGDPVWSGGSILYHRQTAVLNGHRERIWMALKSIGGQNGWYHCNLLWKLSGLFDRLVGGPGMSRGRKHPTDLKRGEVLDCWRVTRILEYKELILTGELKIPGNISLYFKIKELESGRIILEQIMSYVPHGLWGLTYWTLTLPFHTHVLTGMIDGIAKKANCKIIFGPKRLERSIKI
jgi:uncharacterized protein YbjT (DUF2867 family)